MARRDSARAGAGIALRVGRWPPPGCSRCPSPKVQVCAHATIATAGGPQVLLRFGYRTPPGANAPLFNARSRISRSRQTAWPLGSTSVWAAQSSSSHAAGIMRALVSKRASSPGVHRWRTMNERSPILHRPSPMSSSGSCSISVEEDRALGRSLTLRQPAARQDNLGRAISQETKGQVAVSPLASPTASRSLRRWIIIRLAIPSARGTASIATAFEPGDSVGR